MSVAVTRMDYYWLAGIRAQGGGQWRRGSFMCIDISNFTL